MNSEVKRRSEPDQPTKLDQFREQFATWATFSALMVFMVVTIAFWGWAAWQVVVYLKALVF